MFEKHIELILMVFFTATGQLFLKKGVNKNSNSFVNSLLSIESIVGIILLLIAPILYIFALKKLELNYAFSFTSLNFVFVILFSKYFLKEKINKIIIIGTLLISSGVIIIGFS